MAELVDFGVVQEELGSAGFVHILQILHRSKRWLGSDQTPYVLIVTDSNLYYGGTERSSNGFYRISRDSIQSVRIVGPMFWKAIELIYEHKDKENRIYICPFKGSTGRPLIDHERMEEIHKVLIEG